MKRFVLISFISLWLAPVVLAEEWQLQRMPWGDPELQGTWTSATLTNLTRPDDMENLVMTEAQATAWEKYGEDRREAYDDIGEGDLTVSDDPGGYNTFWMDPGTRVLRVGGEPRSSIIVVPESEKDLDEHEGRCMFLSTPTLRQSVCGLIALPVLAIICRYLRRTHSTASVDSLSFVPQSE